MLIKNGFVQRVSRHAGNPEGFLAVPNDRTQARQDNGFNTAIMAQTFTPTLLESINGVLPVHMTSDRSGRVTKGVGLGEK